MKIGINATCFDNRPTGATQRFKGIYREVFMRLRNTEFAVFEPHDCKISSWFDKYENVSFRPTPLSNRGRSRKFLRGLLFWPSALKSERCDIFEAFTMPSARSPTGRTVLTILDIRNAYGELLSKAVYSLVLNDSIRKCDHIITDSESVRHEILSLYPGLAVSVVYNGVDISFFQAASSSDLSSVRRRHNLPDDFILSVGHFERRKNYMNLVTAMAQLRKRKRPVYLVIVGNDNGELAAVKKHVYALGVATNVTILNGLSDFEVSCIYRLCKLFVFPSSYEGFGIPILEAMAAGCPMVLSDIPVFKELTQDQGVYFEHNNPEAIATAIDEVLSSNSERDRLIQYGRERVMEFSFPKVSMALEDVYRTLF